MNVFSCRSAFYLFNVEESTLFSLYLVRQDSDKQKFIPLLRDRHESSVLLVSRQTGGFLITTLKKKIRIGSAV